MLISHLADQIRSTLNIEKVNLIAIDGCAGSGKSTLAARLSTNLACPVIELDDFLSWGDLTTWWPRFELQVLEPVLADRTARFQVRDWENDWLGNSVRDWKKVDAAPFLILEGVGCSRRQIAERLSFTIWVEAAKETRLARGLARDKNLEGAAELWQNWQEMEDDFFHDDPCRERADIVIDGEAILGVDRNEVKILQLDRWNLP